MENHDNLDLLEEEINSIKGQRNM